MPARNLGECQTRGVESVGSTDFGNFSKSGEMSKRNIRTTVEMGERSLDSFPLRKTEQYFTDNTAKLYRS